MKKKFTNLMYAISLATLCSCSQDEIVQSNIATTDGEMELSSVSLSISLGDVTTKALDSGVGGWSNYVADRNGLRGELDHRVTIQVFDTDNGDEPILKSVNIYAPKSGEPLSNDILIEDLRLPVNDNYDVVAWVDFVKEGAAQGDDLWYDTENLSKIAMQNNDVSVASLSQESRDAYVSSFEISVAEDGSWSVAEGDINGSDEVVGIVATRPFAKLRLILTDYDSRANWDKYFTNFTKPFGKVSISVPEATNVLNGLTGAVSGSEPFETTNVWSSDNMGWVNLQYNADGAIEGCISADDATYPVLDAYYFLPANAYFDNGTYSNVTVKTEISSRTFPVLPIVTNKLTTVIGNFITASYDFTIVVNDEFDDQILQSAADPGDIFISADGKTKVDNDPTMSVDQYERIVINPRIVENSANRVSVMDFGAVGDGVTDDSQAFRDAVAAVAADPNGGVVYVPKAEYVVTAVAMKSNVHIHIEAGSTLYVSANHNGFAELSMFKFGFESGEFVKNVVLKGVNGRFNIDISKEKARHRLILLKSVHHFEISNVNIYDNKVQFPLMTFGYNDELNPDIFGPTDGIIKNASSFNNHYGYGLIQAQCARRVHFENLYGEGGVTLRFETGSKTMNENQFGGVHDCVGKNITGVNGNAVVMISPHSMDCGRVQVEEVYCYGSGFAARVDNGYIDKKLTIKRAGKYAPGSFLTNVYSEFGWKAQLKSKHFPYMPTKELLDKCAPIKDKISEPSPAVGAVLNEAKYEIGVWNVTAVGYVNNPIIYETAR